MAAVWRTCSPGNSFTLKSPGALAGSRWSDGTAESDDSGAQAVGPGGIQRRDLPHAARTREQVARAGAHPLAWACGKVHRIES
jgi:hypothetical protein